jgi:hypothetical protein
VNRKRSTEPPSQDQGSSCFHLQAMKVELYTGEVVAYLCPECDRQLPPEWRTTAIPAPGWPPSNLLPGPPPKALPKTEVPVDFWQTHTGRQVLNHDMSRRGLLSAIALLYKRKAEILLMDRPTMARHMKIVETEIARRVEQLSEADRGYLITGGEPYRKYQEEVRQPQPVTPAPPGGNRPGRLGKAPQAPGETRRRPGESHRQVGRRLSRVPLNFGDGPR